jgi:phytoene synthase
MNEFSAITRKGSKTFYLSSLLFPLTIRKDVHILYAYVRTIDDLIDANPPNITQYKKLKSITLSALSGHPSTIPLVSAYVDLFKKKKMSREWLLRFFSSQEMDLTHKRYKDYNELLTFIHGVAEVIGLMMSAVMDLPEKAYPYARKLGRSMQLLNIIRDIPEDLKLGRIYIPDTDLLTFKIRTLDPNKENKDNLSKLIAFELDRFRSVHKSTQPGLSLIPKSVRKPIIMSYNLYSQTADKIYKNPLLVFEKKVRPSFFNIVTQGVQQYARG